MYIYLTNPKLLHCVLLSSGLRVFFSAHTLYVELPISSQTKFCGHHLLYNLYVSFIKHVSELLLAFPNIKAPFKQVRVQPSSTTNLASDCLGATLCIIKIKFNNPGYFGIVFMYETKACHIPRWPRPPPTLTHTTGIMGNKSQPISAVRHHALPRRSGVVTSLATVPETRPDRRQIENPSPPPC